MKYDLRDFREVFVKKTRYYVSPARDGERRFVVREYKARGGNMRMVRVIGNAAEVIALAEASERADAERFMGAAYAAGNL